MDEDPQPRRCYVDEHALTAWLVHHGQSWHPVAAPGSDGHPDFSFHVRRADWPALEQFLAGQGLAAVDLCVDPACHREP